MNPASLRLRRHSSVPPLPSGSGSHCTANGGMRMGQDPFSSLSGLVDAPQVLTDRVVDVVRAAVVLAFQRVADRA